MQDQTTERDKQGPQSEHNVAKLSFGSPGETRWRTKVKSLTWIYVMHVNARKQVQKSRK